MKSESRIKNVENNLIFSMLCQIVNLLINFASRTVFIHVLSKDYLGINSLFANVLTIISFAELGIGNAIVFHLYKPLAINDIPAIKSLMDFYKKAYRYIGMVVVILGLLMVPFLGFIIKDPPAIKESLTIIYLLFLFDTASSYFFTYKKSIIIADQQNYLVDVYTQIIKVFQVGLQIVLLLLTKNYMLYLFIQIVSTFICNIFVAYKADCLYPYLKEKSEKLPKAQSTAIFKDVKALVVYKLGSVVLNGTDNIIISTMLNVGTVGLVSNYHLIILACQSILGRITNAFVASIGNVNAVENNSRKYDIFNKVFFINSLFYGFFSVVLLLLLNDLVQIWLGAEFVLSNVVVISVVLHFYVFGVHNAASIYRTTLGLFNEGKIAPMLAAILNIILSVALCKKIGLPGIFFATSISRLLTMGIVDPIIVFRKIEVPVRKYYIHYLMYMAVYVAVYFITKYILSFITIISIPMIVVKGVIATAVFGLIVLLAFGRSKMFGELLCILKRKVGKVTLKR